MTELDADILIAGGGPFGLMLANELGRRGVSVALFDKKPSTAFNPQANATQARTMEYFRRLGFAGEVRALGLPPDYPTDIAYYTRFAAYEIARVHLPSAKDARAMVARNEGSWAAAEAPHRVSQKYVETVLRIQAEALPGVSVNFGWELTGFRDESDTVTGTVREVDGTAHRTLRARFLVGGDGPRSFVRRELGISYTGETGVVRDFLGGRMYAVYLRCPDFYSATGQKPAWMNWTFNADRRCWLAAIDGKGEFAFHTQLDDGTDEDAITDDDARALFREAVGADIECEILAHTGWTAGHALVAQNYRSGRVFLGGDAVHLFTPTGGLGYNTAVEDAVNLGWKLAAAVKGHAGSALLHSYEQERRPIALRNTGYARGFACSVGEFSAKPGLEDNTATGAELRAEAGAYLEAHGRREFKIPGITFGTRYDGSPVIASDGAVPPPDQANEYVPSAVPGGRPPHWWLKPDVSLYDHFGLDWTLLRLGPQPPEADGFRKAAEARGVSLTVADVPLSELRALYEAPLVIIRPDQIVGWRGESDSDADRVFAILLGHEGC